MNIKSLLLGSAAALVAVSGAKAADAVVIPEPEAVEYVRVCDAAGAGYFYIPGSETCLKFSGYVQYQISTGDQWAVDEDGSGISAGDLTDGWNKATEARLLIESWTDSEYGAITTTMRLTSGLAVVGVDADDAGFVTDVGLGDVFVLDRFHLGIGGLNMGFNGSEYDFSATGAADSLVGNGYTANQMKYTADFGAGSFVLQLLERTGNTNYVPDVVAKVSFSAGDLGLTGAIAYDDVVEAWGAKATATYGGFGAVIQYSEDDLVAAGSSYAGFDTLVIGANYGFDATDKLNLNFGVSYAFEDVQVDDAWYVGAEATYALTDTFTISSRARYGEFDGEDGWDARLRFKASF